MKRWSLASALVAVALLLAHVSGQQPGRGGNYAAGELLVRFRPSASVTQRAAILAGRGANRIRRFDRLDTEHVRLPRGLSVEAAVAAFETIPDVMSAQPNYVRHAIRQNPPPSDPFWLDGSLWGLARIQAQPAWSGFTTGDGNVIVASIDTGVNYTHPDLAPNMWHNPLEIPGNGIDDDGDGYVDDVYGINTVNHDGDPMDDQGHGTHTSGTVAAVGNNGLGVVGVNWRAKLLACKFLDAAGSGTDAGAIECFNYIVMLRNRGENIRVSSNSWGESRSGPPSNVLKAAIDAAGDAGIINIFGAGNDGTDNDIAPFDPASYGSSSIIAVASSGHADEPSYFSNYGGTSVDVAAPGEDILSTYLGTDYEVLSGTSMATPHVAGVAALLASLDPTLSVPAIKALILDNVDQIPDWSGLVVSGGRLNALRAATAVGTGGNTPPAVAITSPTGGASFKVPVSVSLSAAASDVDGTVLQVDFYANGSLIASTTTSPYSVAWSGTVPGSYTLTAVATDNRGAITTSAAVPVTLLANAPPVASVTGPAEGSTFTSPATVTLTADASDSDGSVASVTFMANGAPIGTAATAPYSMTWAAPMGTWAVTAVATDNEGATGTSAPVHITVNPMPGRIDVALAANGGVPSASSTLSSAYPASGTVDGDRKGLHWGAGGGWNDGTQNAAPDWLEVDFRGSKLIEEVDVFSMQDNYSAPTEPTPTMTFTSFGLRAFEVQYWTGTDWADVPGGLVTNNNLVWRQVVFAPLTTSKVRVYITGALNGYSRVMEAEAWGVGAGGNTPPSVAIASPANGAAFVAPASTTISATASDDDGAIQQVVFLANGTAIGTATASPYSVPWTNVPIGSYTLTAVATDNQGATTTSAGVQVNVTASNTPPAVAITAPGAGAVFTAPAGIAVTAAASDTDGSVTSVAFYANGSAIGTATTSPYGVTWSGVAAGTYVLTAVATDNQGATSTSAPVQITVNPIPGRMNMALPANGGVISASSTYSGNYPASGAVNGDRKGLSWGAGGGWNDGTPNTSPDWLEVDFNGPKAIDEVDVFSMQDNYSAPAEPTRTMTFTSWGLRGFEVQYWTGTAWADVPGGAIANNNLVWRQVSFTALTTTKVRVYITAALNGYSRVMEFEAWGVTSTGGSTNAPPTVSITAPADNAVFTAPVTVNLSATAADSDGSIASVTFFANGSSIGSTTASPYGIAWSSMPPGAYALTAVATDNLGATTTSAVVHVTVNPDPGRTNVALAANGSVASASSTYSLNYPASGTINGDRKGLNWGRGGGWNDGTPNTSPDWLEVDFNGAKLIDEIDVFSMQDNYSAPSEPTPTMTFTSWGLRGFEVQYWTGAAWAAVPGGTITNNNLVWRQVTFAALTTTKVRVYITAALNGYSRVIEVEAWGVAASEPAAWLMRDAAVTPTAGSPWDRPRALVARAERTQRRRRPRAGARPSRTSPGRSAARPTTGTR